MKNQRTVMVLLTAAIMLSVIFTGGVQAQDSPLVIENMPNIFGAGVALVPDYQGSDDSTVGAAPFGRITFSGQERYIQLLVTELYANVIDHPFLRFGPAVNYRFGRDDDVEDDVVKKMEEIDGTIEAGLFGGFTFIDGANPRKRFIVSFEYLQDIGGEHEGYTASVSVRFWHPLNKAIDVSLGVGARYADEDYMETYFGVSPSDSAKTGLPVFEADGGINDVRIIPGAVVHLSESWHIGVGARYQRLLGDAEDSPVVDDRGSADQFMAGFAVAYSW